MCSMLRMIAGMFAGHLLWVERGSLQKGVGVHSQGTAYPCAGPGLLLPLHWHLRGSGPFACRPRKGTLQHKASEGSWYGPSSVSHHACAGATMQRL